MATPVNKPNTAADTGSLPSLLPVLGFLRPYKLRLIAASLALLFTAAATLSMGRGLQILIDDGFGNGTSADLSSAIAVLISIAGAIAVGTFVRFYLVSWLGERGDRSRLDEAEANRRPRAEGGSIFIHPGAKAHTVGKIQPEKPHRILRQGAKGTF